MGYEAPDQASPGEACANRNPRNFDIEISDCPAGLLLVFRPKAFRGDPVWRRMRPSRKRDPRRVICPPRPLAFRDGWCMWTAQAISAGRPAGTRPR